MNNRIKELEAQCFYDEHGEHDVSSKIYTTFDREKFAELIVKECLGVVADKAGGPYDIAMSPETRKAWNIWIGIFEHFGVKQ